MNQLSINIKKFRESKGWSKAELGRRLGGISGQLIGQYENESNPKIPGGEFFIKWKKAFGTDLLVSETKVSTESNNHVGLSETNIENQQSLERSLEMALSIASRVTVMLEKKYGTARPNASEEDKEPAGTPEPNSEHSSNIKQKSQVTK